MTQSVNCPGCNKQIFLDDSPQQMELKQLQNQIVELEKKPKTIIQSFIPAYNCPDGNCGAVHKNRNYTMRPKGKCSNCDQFARTDKGICPWCGHDDIESIDDDDLDNWDIPKATAYDYHE